ncbi:MAG: signal recognition particle-docking protein FtsY [Planctomycetota bacterium]|nr:MAG: signal recognition particle-docking protein FtsY [Planctomycetota bacterium]
MLGVFRRGLQKTRNRISNALRELGGNHTTEETLAALEEILYTADVGPLSSALLEEAETKLRRGDFANAGEIAPWLHQRLSGLLEHPGDTPLELGGRKLSVIMVVGVNGCGKTTSVAKLVHWLQQQGHRPLVAAADTFRAAAAEQLGIWCERLGVELVRGGEQADPAAVVHDACARAIANDADVLVVDTAGRLHTQRNLMAELEKIARIAGRQVEDAPHETLLVLDATTGQNAIHQAREFSAAIPLSGVILSKLDGTAKGGAVLAIGEQLGTAVKFVGLGEQVEDFAVFNPEEYTAALLEPRPA